MGIGLPTLPSTITKEELANKIKELKKDLGYLPTLQELDFVFAPTMGGKSSLQSGEIINGTAGQVDISGSDNYFEQGTSKSSATSSGSGGSGSGSGGSHGGNPGGDDKAAQAMAAAKAKEGGSHTTRATASSGGDDRAAAAALKAMMGRRLLVLL